MQSSLTRLVPPSRFVSLLLLALFTVQRCYSGVESDSAQVVAVRVERPPGLDGLLTDQTWSAAVPITNFIQRELHEGMPATERTEVRIVYDDNAMYIGVWCY